jgi:hypothetical protein
MRRLIAVYALVGSSLISLAQTIALPRGEGSVVFESAGGKWQKAVITDQVTGESSMAFSLEAETSTTDSGIERHPRIAFSCQKSGKFDHVRIRTGTIIANQSHSGSEHSSGWALVSTSSDDQEIHAWIADIAKNGSDFLPDKTIISDFVDHKKFVIRFASASGDTITDKYLTDGLSIELLKVDCPVLFKK